MDRSRFVEFILENNKSFNIGDLERYSDTELVILKVCIELDLIAKKRTRLRERFRSSYYNIPGVFNLQLRSSSSLRISR